MINLLAACLALSASVRAVEPKVIYGSDDRRDLHQVRDPRVLALADSTVALFEAGGVALSGGRAKLTASSYASSYNLCKEEPFYEQVVGAFCSGSLVAPDVVMTAGHCVTSAEGCKGVKFVFGFAVKHPGADPTVVAESDVYGCGELLGREQNGADWALIKLDRPVVGHAPLKVNLGPGAANGDPLFVIGHPAGLPTKVAGGANVRESDPKGVDEEGNAVPLTGFFRANLDTYGGNSGSAVFNAKTGLVEGILVRGEVDYEWKQPKASGKRKDPGAPESDPEPEAAMCRVSKVCADDGCRGEDVTKISAVGFPRKMPTPNQPVAVGKSLAALLDQLGSLQSQ